VEKRGIGCTADVMVFALLISTAISILCAFSPADPRINSERYAESFARSTLLSFLNCTADQFGGFSYRLGGLGSGVNIPFIGDSLKRQLGHKTIAQLLAEDILLNMCLEAREVTLSPNREMDDKLRVFLKSVLDNTIDGRFGYRLRASAGPVDLGFTSFNFNLVVEDLSCARIQLCSETQLLSLPVSRAELTKITRNQHGINLPRGLKTELVIEVSLELWST